MGPRLRKTKTMIFTRLYGKENYISKSKTLGLTAGKGELIRNVPES